ncbi:MAG TPA: hypothetical protein VGO95_05500 [Modestobacter sp.]|nr:hypothetical protein [Modestobacter sp.]
MRRAALCLLPLLLGRRGRRPEPSRTNGCTIAQWDRIGPLLLGPVG